MSYSIRPFSGPRYSENEQRATGDGYPCAICGKAVPNDEPGMVWVEVATSGGWAPTDGSPFESIGSFPIGSGCHRKYKLKETK